MQYSNFVLKEIGERHKSHKYISNNANIYSILIVNTLAINLISKYSLYIDC